MYAVETHTLPLKMEVVPVASLHRHEEIIPQVAERLILEFRNLVSLQNPIIVDENHVVLDGNHRAHVFDELKFPFIPVCKIDYLNDRTRLRYWFRLLKNVEDPGAVRSLIEKFGGVFDQVKSSSALQHALVANCLAFGLQQADTYAMICFPDSCCADPVTAYQLIDDIQRTLASQGAALTYIPCKTVRTTDFCRSMKADEMVIWTPHITKDMVVETARQGRRFAPKTTRHVIPVRPLNVNVPGRWFSERLSLSEINRRFDRFLQQKKMRIFSPGLVLDGRYYEEELVVFYD